MFWEDYNIGKFKDYVIKSLEKQLIDLTTESKDLNIDEIDLARFNSHCKSMHEANENAKKAKKIKDDSLLAIQDIFVKHPVLSNYNNKIQTVDDFGDCYEVSQTKPVLKKTVLEEEQNKLKYITENPEAFIQQEKSVLEQKILSLQNDIESGNIYARKSATKIKIKK